MDYYGDGTFKSWEEDEEWLNDLYQREEDIATQECEEN